MNIKYTISKKNTHTYLYSKNKQKHLYFNGAMIFKKKTLINLTITAVAICASIDF